MGLKQEIDIGSIQDARESLFGKLEKIWKWNLLNLDTTQEWEKIRV